MNCRDRQSALSCVVGQRVMNGYIGPATREPLIESILAAGIMPPQCRWRPSGPSEHCFVRIPKAWGELS